MEVKEDFKQTEVGLIPSEWNLPLLGEISYMKGRIGWQGLKQSEFTMNPEDPYLVTGMNFKDGEIRWDEVYHVPAVRYEMAKEIQLKNGDVLITKDGTIGKLIYVRHIPHPNKATLNSHLLVFRPLGQSYEPLFLYYNLSSVLFKKHIELNKSGTTFFGISQETVSKYKIPLPPTKAEQTAIATALNDADALISQLEKLIAKKRVIKQGAMQKCLNPDSYDLYDDHDLNTKDIHKNHSTEEWKVKKLGNCLLQNPDYGINAAAVPFNESLPVYLRITDITEDGKYSKQNMVSVNNTDSQKYYLQNGDLVFARTGSSVGKTYLYKSTDGKLVFTGFLIRVRTNPEILIPEYFQYYTQTSKYWDWIRSNSVRTGQPGINGNEYKDLTFSFPLKDEQIRIAQILSNMDA